MKCLQVEVITKGLGRAPQGARGLKYLYHLTLIIAYYRRAPQGARGLKCSLERGIERLVAVAPRKGRVG